MPVLQRVNVDPLELPADIRELRALPLDIIEKTLVKEVPALSPKQKAANLLEELGGSLKQTLTTVANVMNYGDSEAIRLRAAEKCLEIHGVINGEDRASAPVINFVIQDSDVKIANILQPQRS